MLGAFLRDVIAAEPRQLPHVRARRDGVEPARRRVRDDDARVAGRALPTDEHLGADGRVMEVLSEHLCQGWLEGYLLTGRHGLFNCYEAFIHIVDSMFNQHAKWLKMTRQIPWRTPIASLNYLLTSHVWRQDHNGFSHQDPGFIDHVVNKKAEVIRVYLPPDANSLLSVAGSLPAQPQLRQRRSSPASSPRSTTDDGRGDRRTARAASGIWEWASQRRRRRARRRAWRAAATCRRSRRWPRSRCCASICPSCGCASSTSSTSCACSRDSEHPHGLPDAEFDALFTRDRPVIFAYHGYPWLIHRLTYSRANHDNFHVRGYKEEGTTTTPFDMVMLNDLDRFHLVMDVIDRVPGLAEVRRAPAPGDAGRAPELPRATRASTARTAPTSPAGPGPRERLSSILVVNAGSTSLKLSAVDEGERSRTLAALARPGRRRRGRPPRRARRPRASGRRCCSTTRRSPSCARWPSSRRCTTRPALAAIDDARAAFPELPHVAVFDTEFHATLPDEASTYAVPERWRDAVAHPPLRLSRPLRAMGRRAGAGRGA